MFNSFWAMPKAIGIVWVCLALIVNIFFGGWEMRIKWKGK
jgi:hypothetical protein